MTSPHRTSNTSKIGIILLSASIAGNCALAGALATLYWQPKSSLSQTAEEALCLKIENCLKPATQEAERALQATTTRILTEMEASTTAQRSETDKQIAALLDTIDKTVCSSVHKATESQQARTEEQIAVLTAKINEISGIFSLVSATQTEESKKAMEELLAKATEVQTALTDSAATQQADILKLTETLIAGLKNEGMEQRAKAQEAAAALQSKLEALAQEVTGLNTQLSTLREERVQKAKEYREAAQRYHDTPSVARLLYMSALSFSTDKMDILMELTTWTESLVEQTLNSNPPEVAPDEQDKEKEVLKTAAFTNSVLAQAGEHLSQLAAICESSMATASVADIEKVEELNSRLQTVQSKIEGYRQAAVRPQSELLAEVEQEGGNIADYTHAASLLEKLNLVVDDSLEERKEALIAAILRKQSCLTPHNSDVMIPEIEPETPWTEWLNHFADRLNSSECSLEQKFADFGAAAAFLDEARQKEDTDVQKALKRLEQSADNLRGEDWRKRTTDALRSLKESQDKGIVIHALSDLLAENTSLSKKAQEESWEELIQLNREIVNYSLEELKKGIEPLKHQGDMLMSCEEKNLNEHETSLLLQLLANKQAQYVQLFMQVLKINAQYANAFKKEEGDLRNNIVCLNNIIGGINDRLRTKANVTIAGQQKNYETEVRKKIEAAQGLYNQANGLRSGVTLKTWDSEEVQDKLKNAWDKIKDIHPGDIALAHPGLSESLNLLRQDIEAHRKPTPEELKEIKYMRIEDCAKNCD